MFREETKRPAGCRKTLHHDQTLQYEKRLQAFRDKTTIVLNKIAYVGYNQKQVSDYVRSCIKYRYVTVDDRGDFICGSAIHMENVYKELEMVMTKLITRQTISGIKYLQKRPDFTIGWSFPDESNDETTYYVKQELQTRRDTYHLLSENETLNENDFHMKSIYEVRVHILDRNSSRVYLTVTTIKYVNKLLKLDDTRWNNMLIEVCTVYDWKMRNQTQKSEDYPDYYHTCNVCQCEFVNTNFAYVTHALTCPSIIVPKMLKIEDDITQRNIEEALKNKKLTWEFWRTDDVGQRTTRLVKAERVLRQHTSRYWLSKYYIPKRIHVNVTKDISVQFTDDQVNEVLRTFQNMYCSEAYDLLHTLGILGKLFGCLKNDVTKKNLSALKSNKRTLSDIFRDSDAEQILSLIELCRNAIPSEGIQLKDDHVRKCIIHIDRESVLDLLFCDFTPWAVIPVTPIGDGDWDDMSETIVTFEDLGLEQSIVYPRLQDLGYDEPTQTQIAMIPAILSGEDVCCTGETGSGKTVGYLMPIIQKLLTEHFDHSTQRIKEGVCAIVLSPTKSLSEQVRETCNALLIRNRHNAESEIFVGVLNGDTHNSDISTYHDSLPFIISACPGSLPKLLPRLQLDCSGVFMLVLDEADLLLGNESFKEDIKSFLESVPQAQCVLVSATNKSSTVATASELLGRQVQSVGNSKRLANVVKRVVRIPKGLTYIGTRYNKFEKLADIKQTFKGQKGIAFTTNMGCMSAFVDYAYYNMDKFSDITFDISEFKNPNSGKKFLFTTYRQAARGLNVKDLKYAVLLDLPDMGDGHANKSTLSQASGRVGRKRNGRMREFGMVYLLLSDEECLQFHNLYQKDDLRDFLPSNEVYDLPLLPKYEDATIDDHEDEEEDDDILGILPPSESYADLIDRETVETNLASLIEGFST